LPSGPRILPISSEALPSPTASAAQCHGLQYARLVATIHIIRFFTRFAPKLGQIALSHSAKTREVVLREAGMTDSDADSARTRRLLEVIRGGDRTAFDRLFAHHRAGLRRFVARRLDPGIQARVDASDVVQETQLEAYRRVPCFRPPTAESNPTRRRAESMFVPQDRRTLR